MRVAVLSQYPLDRGRVVGGIEAVMVSLLPKLASFDDLDLHVVTCQGGVEDRLGTTWSGQPLHVRRRQRLGRLTFHARERLSLRRTLGDISPDIVHAQGIGLYSLAAIGARCPHVATLHGFVFREVRFYEGLLHRMRGSLDVSYERYCLSRLKNLISINPYVEQEMVRLDSFRGRVFRVANPVAERFFVPLGHPDGSAVECEGASGPVPQPGAGQSPTILYAGRVLPRKALLTLLRALVTVREVVPQVTLRVVGEADSDPEYATLCREFIAQHGLSSSVTFLGSVTTEEMVEEYTRCALLAMPSEQETAPVALAEAMAVGRPVVATRACGMQYMVEDGQSGLLVEPGDLDGVVGALTALLTNPDLGRKMGRRGRELAEQQFHPMQVARATRDVYYKVLGGQS